MDEAVTEALARIRRAAAAHARAERRLKETRADLHAAIVEAFAAGARPVEVDAVSPYDRNHNARIRAQGNGPVSSA